MAFISADLRVFRCDTSVEQNRKEESYTVSAESEILAAIQAHVAARKSGDVDALVNSYSEEWSDDKGYRKQTLQNWHLGSTYDDAEIDITIE